LEVEFAMHQPIDDQRSTAWAIANLVSGGGGEVVGGSVTLFDLVNRITHRAHLLQVTGTGLGFALLPFSGSFSPSNYTYFYTPRPVNFDDFDMRGARLASFNLVLYSLSELTVWDGAAYGGQVLFEEVMTGWGPSIAGIGFEHGVCNVRYTDGKPRGVVELMVPPFHADTPDDPTFVRSAITAHDDASISIDSDALFDIDKWDIKPGAEKVLGIAAVFIRSHPGFLVHVEGYTDSTGDDIRGGAYNVDLSWRRAGAVAMWLTTHNYVRVENIEQKGWGSQFPVAPNDREENRKKNRRVRIYLTRHV
jgi:outer membrane protein OmpA-like peptidoglycan-associated protein